MGLIDVASGNSIWRGLDYSKENKVLKYKKINDVEYEGIVCGSNKEKYNVFMNIKHPKQSKCDCPHAKDKRIICKHIIALYFTIFPEEVDKFLKEVEKATNELANKLYHVRGEYAICKRTTYQQNLWKFHLRRVKIKR